VKETTMTTAQMTELAQLFRSARNVSTPLMAIWTADPAATVAGLLPTVTDVKTGQPFAAMQWDVVRGLRGLNQKGAATVQAIVGASGSKDDVEKQITEATRDCDEALRLVARAERGTVVFLQNGVSYWDNPGVAQAIWNLRDVFKATARALVVLGPDGSRVPRSLQHDVMVFNEPLPGRDELAGITLSLHTAAGLAAPNEKSLARIVDATAGLSAFAAEQVIAMSLRKDGVDQLALRARRRQSIENTPGLSVHRGPERFDDLGGLHNLKKFCHRVKTHSREPIKAVAFMDEIDKVMAGVGAQGGPGDSSGVSQYQLRACLTNIRQGMLFYGIQGTGKTDFAKIFANELDVDFLDVDLGGMQAGIVGESQANTIAAMKVVEAVGQGHTLWIATANGLVTLPTELRRRLRTFGEWFFDIPDEEELKAIVTIYLRKWGLKVTASNPLPDMTDWTGAEVRNCLYMAYDLELPFAEAAEYVVPLAVSSREIVARIRTAAAGRFRSASRPGFYQAPQAALDVVQQTRSFASLEDAALGMTAIAATAGKKAN
jgi:hypothetical protein